MSLKGSEPREVEPPLPMMEMIDDNKDRNGGKNFSNNGRKPRRNTDFDYFDTNSGEDILSQTSDDSSVCELESGQLVLKKATTAKKQNGTEKRKHKKDLHSCVSKPHQEELGWDNSCESDLESSQPVLKKAKAAKKNVREINNKKHRTFQCFKGWSRSVSHSFEQQKCQSHDFGIFWWTSIENIHRDYLYQVIKDLGGKVYLAKSLNTDALFKAVAVRLVNHSCIKIKNPANLSNLKRSDIAFIKK